jgi:hypothetical protein
VAGKLPHALVVLRADPLPRDLVDGSKPLDTRSLLLCAGGHRRHGVHDRPDARRREAEQRHFDRRLELVLEALHLGEDPARRKPPLADRLPHRRGDERTLGEVRIADRVAEAGPGASVFVRVGVDEASALSLVEVRRARRPRAPGDCSTAVHLATVRDSGDDHQTLSIIDGVDHAVVADPDAVVIAAGQLGGTPRPRIVGEGVDRGADPVS